MATMNSDFEQVRLSVPVTLEDIADLNIGTVVYLDGTVYTAWDDLQDFPLLEEACANETPVQLATRKGGEKRTGGHWPDTIKGVQYAPPDNSPSADDITF